MKEYIIMFQSGNASYIQGMDLDSALKGAGLESLKPYILSVLEFPIPQPRIILPSIGQLSFINK